MVLIEGQCDLKATTQSTSVSQGSHYVAHGCSVAVSETRLVAVVAEVAEPDEYESRCSDRVSYLGVADVSYTMLSLDRKTRYPCVIEVTDVSTYERAERLPR
jgi:hypothetical protein